MQFWLLSGTVVVWGSVFLLHAVRFELCELSPFELKRRLNIGDSRAKEIAERDRLLPRLQTVHRIVEVALTVVAIALTIAALGWIAGTLLATALVLSDAVIARSGPVAKVARRIYEPREPQLLHMLSTWSWLDWYPNMMAAQSDARATSKAELENIIKRSNAVLSPDELMRLQASLELDTKQVEDVMTPVSMVHVAGVHDSLGPLVLDDLHKTGHSRFPVIDGDISHVVGILYLHDSINLKSTKPSVREAMDTRVNYIHEAQTLEQALHGFLRTHRHLFVVVNDYRETVGVLTLEDVLEALLGKKIVDEFDRYEDLRAVAESNPAKNNMPKGKTDI